jgi:hypothetical protein
MVMIAVKTRNKKPGWEPAVTSSTAGTACPTTGPHLRAAQFCAASLCTMMHTLGTQP